MLLDGRGGVDQGAIHVEEQSLVRADDDFVYTSTIDAGACNHDRRSRTCTWDDWIERAGCTFHTTMAVDWQPAMAFDTVNQSRHDA